MVRVTGLEPAHHLALEPNGNVTLLKLSIASVISIISDVLKRVKGIWVVYVMSVCRRHRRQFDITIVFVLTVL